jgi:sugar-phosphatase
MGWKVDEVVRQLTLGRLFDVVVTAAEIEWGKPDPACYLTAAAKLQLAPAHCVVFEDSVSGVRAAVAAGMVCIGVQSGHLADVLTAEGVRHVIPDFSLAQLDLTGDGMQLRLPGGFALTFLGMVNASS